MRNILFVLFVSVILFIWLAPVLGDSHVADPLPALLETYLGASRAVAFVVILVVLALAGAGAYLSRCRFGRHQPKLIAPSVRTPSG